MTKVSAVFGLLVSATILFSAVEVRAARTLSVQWHLEQMEYDSQTPFVGVIKIRAGYFKESVTVPFRGNILYLEGLGDSIINHDPFFERLSEQGYRVVAFDYPGQGGSLGTMDHTRVVDKILPRLQISSIAEKVWEKFRKKGTPKSNSKVVIGWSTGGLAAYELASRQWANAVVLIAPGIVIRPIVGEGGKITLPSLTSDFDLPPDLNPHLDPIRPGSPFEVPIFAGNLALSAGNSWLWTVDSNVPGLIFFGGQDDYVVSKVSRKPTDLVVAEDILKLKAPHFKIVDYPSARHEIHNEKPQVQESLTRLVIDFLNQLN